jgi:hypothetical protein
MVNPWHRNSLLLAAILVFGGLRMPFEVKLREELQAASLIPRELEIGTRDKIGQTSSAVALGGLRTLVATFLNLRAFGFFESQRWDDVADTYDIIVDLAPKTRYYWESGTSHSAYNASSYYLNESKLPPLRRREAWRASVLRGRAFLERGIKNNPDDWSLLRNLGFLLSDTNLFPAFRNPDETFMAAACAYQRSAATGKALPYVSRAEFIALARVRGKEREALALGQSIYLKKENRAPTVSLLLMVLEAHENPSLDSAKRATELFGNAQVAYENLCRYWQRTRELFPIYGVAGALQSLERTLNIAGDKSIFNSPLQSRPDADEWFQK